MGTRHPCGRDRCDNLVGTLDPTYVEAPECGAEVLRAAAGSVAKASRHAERVLGPATANTYEGAVVGSGLKNIGQLIMQRAEALGQLFSGTQPGKLLVIVVVEGSSGRPRIRAPHGFAQAAFPHSEAVKRGFRPLATHARADPCGARIRARANWSVDKPIGCIDLD